MTFKKTAETLEPGAHTLEREYYTSSDVLQKEYENLFLNNWICAGRCYASGGVVCVMARRVSFVAQSIQLCLWLNSYVFTAVSPRLAANWGCVHIVIESTAIYS